jgi:DNA-binding NtrC family response regulator
MKQQATARVMAVDDHADWLETLRLVFLARGHGEPLLVQDGKAALRLSAQERPWLVLLDLHMPGCTGTDLLPRLRTQPHRPLVVVVSGQPDPALAVRCLRMGAIDYVGKSEGPQRLHAAITAAEQARTADPLAATLRTLPRLPSPQEAQARVIDEALHRSQGNQHAAARLLGVSAQSLNQRLRRRPSTNVDGDNR